mmetsp:Transcript_29411/g.73910  ORF Transcript_29411/g.73910 Transcript_29411/m.73910 type:complete len:472 (+) Transcript_29411:229-1644(+)
MQLDPGPKSSRVVKDAGLGAAMSYQPKRRTSLWNKTLKILGLFLVVFFVTELLLYEKLTGALSHAKGVHRDVARHVRHTLRQAMVQGDAPFITRHVLPRPQLFRWYHLPQISEIARQVDPPELSVVGVPLPTAYIPQYMKEPSWELAADTVSSQPGDSGEHGAGAKQDDKQRPKLVLPEGIPIPPSHAVSERAHAGSKIRQDAYHSDAPGLSKQVLKSLDVHARLQSLLSTEVDLVLNNILLEMRGSISCGGHMVMEFKNFEEVAAVSEDLKSVLPESDPFATKPWGSCAIVGNSGKLLTHTHGKEIDSHDTVIRFNAAPTRNFETHVGSKTTIRVQNVDNLGFRERASDKYLIFSARSKKDLSRFYSHRKRYEGRSQFAFNPEFWCYVWDWVDHRKLKPTSGMAGVVMALKHCQHPVDMYGFSHNATEFHYFNKLPEKVTHTEIYKYHPLVEEAEIYRELMDMNMTQIFA